jgi:hypothetical protein
MHVLCYKCYKCKACNNARSIWTKSLTMVEQTLKHDGHDSLKSKQEVVKLSASTERLWSYLPAQRGCEAICQYREVVKLSASTERLWSYLPAQRGCEAICQHREVVKLSASTERMSDWLSLIIFCNEKLLQDQFYISTKETNTGGQLLRNMRVLRLWQRLLRCDVVQMNLHRQSLLCPEDVPSKPRYISTNLDGITPHKTARLWHRCRNFTAPRCTNWPSVHKRADRFNNLHRTQDSRMFKMHQLATCTIGLFSALHWTSVIVQSVLRQVLSLFQSELSTQCDLVLPLSISSVFSSSHFQNQRQMHWTNHQTSAHNLHSAQTKDHWPFNLQYQLCGLCTN